MQRNDFFLGAAMVAVGAAVGLAQLVRISDGMVVAAWVQALGTIGAVVAAAWISRADARKTRDDRISQARRAALRLLPILATAARAVTKVYMYGASTDYGLTKVGQVDNATIVRDLTLDHKFPDDTLIDFGALDPDTVALVVTARHALRQCSDFFAEEVPRLFTTRLVGREHYLGKATSHIDNAFASLRAAKNALEPIAMG